MSKAKHVIESLLDQAGIKINGNNPWDIVVHNEDLYQRVLLQGNLGLGEAYMDGWWDSPQIDQFIYKILSSNVHAKINPLGMIPFVMKSLITNTQSRSRAFQIGEKHYDAGNDLYTTMLDSRMVYTCGYWKTATTLDQAQEDKLKLVCEKIGLKPGMRILDIGCGWGSFAKFAAEKYGVSVVGVTVSKEQVKLAQENCAGLPVEIRLQDYRDIKNEQFDHIVSLGMFEHVGYKNYRIYFEVAQRVLKDDGLFLLHTIGGRSSVHSTDRWIEKYIFTNSMIPSIAQIAKAVEKLFVIEDVHNFGQYYDLTLLEWHKNFVNGWPNIKDQYSERFYRMWVYYLLSCAGSFRARQNQLWQIVLSKEGVLGGYQSIR